MELLQLAAFNIQQSHLTRKYIFLEVNPTNSGN
jgi:hypothetical protein